MSHRDGLPAPGWNLPYGVSQRDIDRQVECDRLCEECGGGRFCERCDQCECQCNCDEGPLE